MKSAPSECPKTVSRHPVRRWAGSLGLVLLLFLALHWWQTRPLASGAVPPLHGLLVTGQPFALEDLRGQPVLVHFWAEWCPICALEQASIQAVAKDFNLIAVAIQSGDARAVSRHMANKGIDFPTIADPHGEIATAWGVTSVPVSFFIDSNGRVRFAEAGYTTEAGLRARYWGTRQLSPDAVPESTHPGTRSGVTSDRAAPKRNLAVHALPRPAPGGRGDLSRGN